MKKVLVILSVLSYATMAEIRFHWPRLFAHWFPAGHDQWWNPSVSWQNKYFESGFLTFIFSTLLVPFTDFYHFLQFIFLNCIFLFILLLSTKVGKKGEKWWVYIVVLLMINIAWGILFELFLGIYGALSDKYM